MRVAATCKTLEDVDVECTHCEVAMTCHVGSSTVRYFHCPSCHRWISSMYSEVLRGDTKVRARPRGEGTFGAFGAVRDRLSKWLSALDEQDPYRTLGVSPNDSTDRIREKYRELALVNHPDRGGTMERMRAINDAYEKIALHRERRESALAAQAALPAAGGQ